MTRLGSIVVAAIVLVGCASPAASSDIDVELQDGRILTSTSSYEAGPVTLSATNTGELPHTVVVTDASGEVVAASALIAPGSTVDLDVDLAGGAYEITCRIVTIGDDGTVLDHYAMGMLASIRG